MGFSKGFNKVFNLGVPRTWAPGVLPRDPGTARVSVVASSSGAHLGPEKVRDRRVYIYPDSEVFLGPRVFGAVFLGPHLQYVMKTTYFPGLSRAFPPFPDLSRTFVIEICFHKILYTDPAVLFGPCVFGVLARGTRATHTHMFKKRVVVWQSKQTTRFL